MQWKVGHSSGAASSLQDHGDGVDVLFCVLFCAIFRRQRDKSRNSSMRLHNLGVHFPDALCSHGSWVAFIDGCHSDVIPTIFLECRSQSAICRHQLEIESGAKIFVRMEHYKLALSAIRFNALCLKRLSHNKHAHDILLQWHPETLFTHGCLCNLAVRSATSLHALEVPLELIY